MNMLSRQKRLWFGAILSVSGALSHAETVTMHGLPGTGTQRIDLNHAIGKTLEYNPGLRSFAYQVKAQQGLELQAGLRASPEFQLTIEDALGTGAFNGADKVQTTLGISWVIERKIRQGHAGEARAGTASLYTEVDIKRLDAAAETARLYIACLANQARLKNADQTLQLANETVIAVKRRVMAGKASEVELARAEADREKKRLAREEIEHRLRSAVHLLAAQWGELNPVFTTVEGDILNLPAPPSFDTLSNHLEQSPGFLRLLSEKRIRQAQLQLALYQSRPAWQANLGIRRFEASDDQALVAGISIPFGKRARNSGRIYAAEARLSQTRARQDEFRIRMETTLFILSEELQHSMHRASAHRERIIPLLEQALGQARHAYDTGRYSYLEWRSAQMELLNARISLIEDSTSAHLKLIEIERLTGVSLINLAGEKL